MKKEAEALQTYEYHRFLDEAGDTTFFGKGKIPIVGTEGVSKCFILGMLKVKEPLQEIRGRILELQENISTDPYFKSVPSIVKKASTTGYFIHAKDDVPEVRKMAFELINSVDCSFEAYVGRKDYGLYERNHNGKEAEFYADLLSHLLKNKLSAYQNLVLNISDRGTCTAQSNLEKGLQKAIARASAEKDNVCKVVFNVQKPTTEPLLSIADYFCWAVQRVFERGATRYYDFVFNKISLVVDLYDSTKYAGNKNYYRDKNPLTTKNWIK